MGDSFTSAKVLASHDGKATLVQSGNILAATFHPELSDDPTVHRHFLSMFSDPAADTCREQLEACVKCLADEAGRLRVC